MKKKSRQKLKMSTWMKLHAAFTIFLLVFYTTLGILGGFGMLAKDLAGKYAWAAGTTISVFVDAMPGKPVITATTSCSSTTSIINLSWTQSEGATIYSATRDGILLVSGFQTMGYSDSNVVAGHDYSYVVTASGSSGDSISDPLVVRAKDCNVIVLPEPTVKLVSLDGKEIAQGITPKTTKNIFKITGTTNMPNAYVQVKTMPGPVFVSTLRANSTGYWEYYLPGQLPVGFYNFQITATDPDTFSRNITENYIFEIINSPTVPPVGGGGDNHYDNKNHHNGGGSSAAVVNNPSSSTPQVEPVKNPVNENNQIPVIEKPIVNEAGSIVMYLENKNGEIYRTQDLQMRIIFSGMENTFVNSNVNILDLKYEIVDSKGRIVSIQKTSERIFGRELIKTIHVPEELPNGNYKIRASLASFGKLFSAENTFLFSEMPILNMGGGIMVTYSQFLSQIGWLLIIALLLLLFFGFMFFWEYHIFKRAIMTVSDDNLIKRGIISKRKGVPR